MPWSPENHHGPDCLPLPLLRGHAEGGVPWWAHHNPQASAAAQARARACTSVGTISGCWFGMGTGKLACARGEGGS